MDFVLDATPALFPLDVDIAHERVRLVALDEAAYRAASFLDDRILPQTGAGVWASLDDVVAIARDLSAEADFIFHMGHVGSTLLSRILDVSEQVFSVREPAILRMVADHPAGGDPRPHLADFARLFARVWRSDQRALVKTTSFVSDLGGPLMAAFASARAILMFAPPAAYMAGMLAGSATRPDLKTSAPRRLVRLHRRLGGDFWRAEALSEGELAALAWACEVVALFDVAGSRAGRVMWLDFEAFLARPYDGLATCLEFLHGSAPTAVLESMINSPDFGRYSKAPDHAYDARLRAQILAAARREHDSEIERGLAWLTTAGRAHPLIAEAARAAAAGSRRAP